MSIDLRPRLSFTAGAVALVALLATGCGEPSQEELLQAATEALAEAEVEVEEASAELALREEELALAQAARDQAAQRLRDGERVLTESREQVGLHATDGLLFRKVQQALLEDEALSDVAVSARVDDGVVTLTGEVPDEATRERANTVARSVPGVAEVKTLLRVPAPPKPAPDTD